MFRTIPSATLKRLVKLSARKEALLAAALQAIDREMVRLEQKHGVPVRRAPQAKVTVSGSSEKEEADASATASLDCHPERKRRTSPWKE